MGDPKSQTRYDGKPLLRLLECYVLWTVGELSETDANLLMKMTPKLRSIYKVQGNWQQIIATVMQLPPNMPALIVNLWNKNKEITRRNGAMLSPQHFAEMFVDQNLAK
jgi:hypothetical protein